MRMHAKLAMLNGLTQNRRPLLANGFGRFKTQDIFGRVYPGFSAQQHDGISDFSLSDISAYLRVLVDLICAVSRGKCEAQTV